MLLSELLSGTTRFNDLRRGLPRVSPALLSKRLKELEEAGVIYRSRPQFGHELFEYRLTDAGRAVEPVVKAMGDWGHRWVTTEASLEHLDVKLLMWNMRRKVNPEPMPRRRSTIQIIYRDLPAAQRNWWLIVEPERDIDLCSVEPGFDVDLYITTDLRTMTEVWMGYSPLQEAIDSEAIVLAGDRDLEETFQIWLGASTYASIEKCVA